MAAPTYRISVRVWTALFFTIGLGYAQFTVEPPTTASEDTIQDCTLWAVAEADETCQTLADANFVSLEDLLLWNPVLADDCDVAAGVSYCTEQNWSLGPVEGDTADEEEEEAEEEDDDDAVVNLPDKPASSEPQDPTPAAPANGITTPADAMPDIVADCAKFHLVTDKETCDSIARAFGIPLVDFLAWNPATGPGCRSLWLNASVCVGLIRDDDDDDDQEPSSPTATAVQLPTTTGTPIETSDASFPTPADAMPDIVAGCTAFHQVAEGDNCQSIAKDYGISLDDFYDWNPAAGDTCLTLWLAASVCVKGP